MLKEFKIYYFTKSDGTEYSGGMHNDVPSGFGIFKNKNGKEYRCEWKEGTIHGIANIIYVDGREFLGKYKSGQKNGVGKVTFGNKIYLGEFHQNQRTGSGELIERDGSELLPSDRNFGYFPQNLELGAKYLKKGYYVNGRLNGFGINEVPFKNYSYVGYYVDGSSDGDGIEVTKEGTYNGKFKRGLRHGPGEFQGEVSYRGYWSKGLKDRFGIEKTATGEEFEGDFEKGKKNGAGNYKNLDGVSYTGFFKKSMRSSFGKLEQGGSIYVGGFKENKKSGLGYYKDKNQSSYFGEWEEDMKHGLGYEVKIQDEYKGEFFNGVRHGKGILRRRGEEKMYVVFNQGILQGIVKENLSYLKVKFTKNELDSFFASSKNKLDGIIETLDEQRSQFEIDISFIKTDFKDEQLILSEKLLYNRNEMSKIDMTYKALIRNFEKNVTTQMGKSLLSEKEDELAPSSERGENNWQPMSFTPGKYDQSFNDVKIKKNLLQPIQGKSKDGETGRLMNSDYYTNMLKNTFNLKKSNTQIFSKNSSTSFIHHNNTTTNYFEEHSKHIISNTILDESIKKKLNFSQSQASLHEDLDALAKSKLEIEMKARELESARRRHTQAKMRLQLGGLDPEIASNQLSSKDSRSNGNSFNMSKSSLVKKKKISTPHKIPPPESNRKNVLKGAPRSVYLDIAGFEDITFFDDVMLLAGVNGVLCFQENYGSFSILARNEDISVTNIKFFEERRWIIGLEHSTRNLLIFNMQLDVVDKIEINEESEHRMPHTSLFIKDNLCIWNSNNDVYVVDLYSKKIKKISSLFEVKDLNCENLAFIANPRKQTILGYSKSVTSDNVYAIFAEENINLLKTENIIHISDRFSVCRDFRCLAECGDHLFLVGGSALIEKNKSKRPFITLHNLDSKMAPISGKILDEPGCCTFSCIKTLEDEDGYTVCAGSKGYIFIFKVRNSVLELQQKYKLDIESSKFLPDCIDYYASSLYLISKEYPQIMIIQMNNYKPTRPHSLSFNRWNIDNVYKNIQKLNEEKLDLICKREKPFTIVRSTLDKYQEIVSFNLGNNRRCANLKNKIKNYNFKLMNKIFTKLSDYEIQNIMCYSEAENSNFWTVKVLTGEKNLVCLDDFIIKFKFDFKFASYNEKSNNLFILEEPGDLIMISLNSGKLARAFDFSNQMEGFELTSVTSTANCLRIFGVFNNYEENRCGFKIHERNNTKKSNVQFLPHLMNTCQGCEIDFNQEIIFTIGKMKEIAVLAAFQFDSDMLFAGDFMRNKEEFRSINRVPGTNLLILGTVNSILMLSYFEESFVLEREVNFEKNIEEVEMIKGDIWIKFEGLNEITKYGLTPKDLNFNKELLIQNERKSKLEHDEEFFGNSLETNYSKNDLLRLFSSYNLKKEANDNIQEKVRIDIEKLNKEERENDSDNKATAKGSYGSGIQGQNLSKLEKTMPKFGFDDSKKFDSDVEDVISKTDKVLEALEKLDSFEKKSDSESDKEVTSDHEDDFDLEKTGLEDTEHNSQISEKQEEKDNFSQEEEDEENYATFNKNEEDQNSKPHVPKIPDFINASQHSSIKGKESGSNIETTKKLNDQPHSATSYLPTNKPLHQDEPPIEWFWNYKITEFVNVVETKDIIKIRVSTSGKFIYLLTSQGLMIVEMDSSRLITQTLTEEEIYNFFCLEGDICIAYAVNRSSVLVFKGKKIVNVLHSDDESSKPSFLTGISSYEPKFKFDVEIMVDKLEFDKRIIEESNEESNNDEDSKGEVEKKEENSKIKFLWMEGRLGVKYLEYDPKEMDVSSGELLTLWKNERDFQEFIILAVEELPKRNMILGLAFQDNAENTFLQVYDLNVKHTQSVFFKDKEIFENKVLVSMISMSKDRSLVCAGCIKRGPEDELGDSLIMVLTLEKDAKTGKVDLHQENMAVFTSYSKFWTVKKVNDFDFIACAEWDLLIMRYEDKTIYTCQVIEEISENFTVDACVFGNSVYVACQDINSMCKVIEFEDEIPVGEIE